MRSFIINSISILVLSLTGFVNAQSLVSLDGNLSFSNTDELQASTQSLRLFNPNSYPITINEVDRFHFYNDKIFSVSDSQFTVLPNDTFNLTVSFAPEHNVLHEQVLIFKSSSGFGHTAVEVNGQGTYSRTYYSSTQNKSQEQLKTALSARLALGYNSLGYTGARDQMYASIDNNSGQVECVYTGRTASFNTRSGANSNSFNCEHTFPQGFFSSNNPMRSDIHHLFPTDVSANSRRGNDPFGVVSNATWTQGGSKSGGGKFEPRDAQKGATARAMMYFVIRYQDYSNHFSGQEAILRQWHDAHPPTTAERNRNADIYTLQNNRNPFVDYPQFVERISDIDGTASAPAITDLYASDDTIFLAQGPQITRTYSFVLYNSGTDNLSVAGFSLSDPNLSFSNGSPGNVSLDAGESLTIEIDFMADQSYQTNLSYQVSGGIGLKTVPIVSGPGLSLPATLELQVPDLYPIPSDGIVFIADYEMIQKLELIDASGRTWKMETAAQLDLSDFPKGVYSIRAQLKNKKVLFLDKIVLY